MVLDPEVETVLAVSRRSIGKSERSCRKRGAGRGDLAAGGAVATLRRSSSAGFRFG